MKIKKDQIKNKNKKKNKQRINIENYLTKRI